MSTLPQTPAPPSKIGELLAVVRKLAAADGKPETFYTGWLQQTMLAAEAVGGRLRRPAADGTLAVTTMAGSKESFGDDSPADSSAESSAEAAGVSDVESGAGTVGSGDGPSGSEHGAGDAAVGKSAAPSRYTAMLLETYALGRPKIIPPAQGLGSDAAANPTTGVLIVTPLAIDGEIRGVVELVLPEASGPEARRGAVNLVLQASTVVGEFERGIREKKLAARASLVDEVERFTRAVHEKLSLRATAYTAANDGRRLVGCDRTTVLVRRGRRYDIEAVGGLEVVETRSQAAKLLAALVRIAAEVGEPVWYDGDAGELSPQLREALGRYVDESHARSVGILPVYGPLDEKAAETAKHRRREPLGAIVCEQFADGAVLPGREERARLVAEHAGAALANARQHEQIPLLPLWRATAAVREWFAPGTRKKTLAILAVIAAAGLALKFVPADFPLHSRGVLQPRDRHHVFAPLDATVKTIFVKHGDRVAAGAPLVQLRNTDLEVSLADVVGQRASSQEQLLAVERALYEDGTKLAAEERHRLAGQRSELKQRLASLDEQAQLLRRKREQLLVVSPIAGEVTTWNIEQLLRDRPVKQGQVLVDVADTSGEWELQLEVPEDGIGHLLRARRETGDALKVGYRVAAEPENDRFARLGEVDWAAEVRGDEGNTVLVRAAIDPADLPPLRPGAEVTAKVYCGRRSLGYVWLHDAVDFVRTKVFFRTY
jgi:multidrug efflux pump subunit AcrA (membrane-fusion protein)